MLITQPLLIAATAIIAQINFVTHLSNCSKCLLKFWHIINLWIVLCNELWGEQRFRLNVCNFSYWKSFNESCCNVDIVKRIFCISLLRIFNQGIKEIIRLTPANIWSNLLSLVAQSNVKCHRYINISQYFITLIQLMGCIPLVTG